MKSFLFTVLLLTLTTSMADQVAVGEMHVLRVCRLVTEGSIEEAVNFLKDKGYHFTDKRVWHSIKCTSGRDSTLFETLTNDGSKYVSTKDLMRKIMANSSHNNLKTILNCTDRDGDTVLDYINLGIEISSDPMATKDLVRYKAIFIRAGALTGSESTEGSCLE
jgi:hypothetical protein